MKRFKNFIAEADTSDSTKLENSLCYYYNESVGGEELTAKQAKDLSGGLTKSLLSSYPKVDNKVIESMSSFIRVGPYLQQCGEKKGEISADWKRWGASTKDYKTDVYECDSSGGLNGNRYSMKNQDARILGSAFGETKATFQAAYKHYEANSGVKIPQKTKNDIKANIKGMMPFTGPVGSTPRGSEYQLTVNQSKNWAKEWYISRERDGSGRYQELKAIFPKENDRSIEDHMKNELNYHKVFGSTFNQRKILSKNNRSYMITIEDMKKKLLEYSTSDFLKKKVKEFGVESRNIEDAKKFVYNLVSNAFLSEGWQNNLREVLEGDEDLKRWIVFESASGWYKFYGKVKTIGTPRDLPEAVATHMLSVNPNSVNVTPILSWSNQNRNLVRNVSVNFKSSGSKEKTSRRAWNILSIEMESYGKNMNDEILLDEGIRDFFNNVGNKINSLSRKAWNNINDFFTGIVEYSKEAWQSFLENVAFKLIDYIVDLLDLGIDAFLNFLGYEIEGSFS